MDAPDSDPGAERPADPAAGPPAGLPGGPRTRPSAAGPSPRAITCEQCRRLFPAYLEGTLPSAASVAMRHHVGSCGECRDAYKGALESGRRMGRALRTSREEEQRHRRRAEQRRRALQAGGTERRRRGFYLRLMLVPAAMVVLLHGFSSMGGSREPVRAVWLAGAVDAVDFGLSPALPEAELARGDWCRTGLDGTARLERGGTRVRLGGSSLVLVEEQARVPRLRVARGDLTVEGPCELTAASGFVRVARGTARVRADRAALRVECITGELTVSHHQGRRSLRGGDAPVLLGPGGFERAAD